MNVGRGCVVTHVFLESCARKEVGICFVGECWVPSTGNGTQSHPDYVMLGNASKGTKVVVYIGRGLVNAVRLVATTARAVVVEVGGCRVGGVYGKCGVGVHAIEKWLSTLGGWVGGGDWVLLGHWNAHHTRGHGMGSQDLGQGAGRVGPRARRGGPLWGGGDIRAKSWEGGGAVLDRLHGHVTRLQLDW